MPLQPNVRNWIKQKTETHALDKWTCRYCGAKFSEFEKWLFLTIDHIIPRKQKGEVNGDINDKQNMATACRSCNNFLNRTRFDIPKGMPFTNQIDVVFRKKKEEIMKKREEYRRAYQELVVPKIES